MEFIRKSGKKGVTRSQISRKFQRTKDFDTPIKRLITDKKIEMCEGEMSKNHKRTTFYKALDESESDDES